MTALSRRRRLWLIAGSAGTVLLLGTAVVVTMVLQAHATKWVYHTQSVLQASEQAVGSLVNAETGQRGYLLTGNEAYLAPYTAGIRSYREAAGRLRELTSDNPDQQGRIDSLETWAALKAAELARTVELRRTQGLAAALALVESDSGKMAMDSVRHIVTELRRAESALLESRQASHDRMRRFVFILAGLGTLVGVLVTLLQGIVLSGAITTQESLTAELAERARNLEDTAGELEMSNEELNATNDQLQETVEELQASTEELATANDALRQSEERFRTLAEHLPISLFACGPDGTTDYVNPAWTRIAGLSPDETRTRGWMASVHPEDLAEVQETWKACLRGEPSTIQYRHLLPDGSVRYVRTTCATVRNAAGQSIAILGTGLDMTELYEQEEQLRHVQRMQAVGRLAGGMAHELNNMLTASLGFGEFALRSLPEDHPAVQDISEGLKAQERAVRLTSQVLSFSRRQMLSPVRFELGHALEELAPLLRQSLTPGQTLQFDLGPEDGAVHVDRVRFDQAIVNLALNARDAMPPNGRLTLATRRVVVGRGQVTGPEGEYLPPGNYLVVSVEDDGAGMEAETRRRAFEPFFSTKPVGEGTGLGLSMTYGFARQSGGTVTLQTSVGRGTVARLYLPEVARDAAGAAPRKSETRPPRGNPVRVLVVDDEPSVRSMMRRSLVEEGYDVLEAGAGSEALATLENGQAPVRLVICDLIMPDMEGGTLGTLIVERWPNLAVLYVSGFPGADGAEEKMMPAGATFLRKPFSPKELIDRVRMMVGAMK